MNLPEGYTARPLQMTDLSQTVELYNQCSRAMIQVQEFSEESLRNEWETPKFDLEQSSLGIFSDNGQLIAAAEVWDLGEIPVQPWVWGNVHPSLEGRGFGTALLKWGEAKARRVIERVPENARVVMFAGTYHAYEPSGRLLAEWGMQRVRYFWRMVMELSHPPDPPAWPAGIELRPYRHEQDAESFYRAEHEAFLDHWGQVEESFAVGFERWRHRSLGHPDFNPALWFMAWEGDEIAGVIRSRPRADDDPAMGWVSVLGVRKPWRNRGLGLALLKQSFADFYARGTYKVGLGVDAANLTGATRLYEKAGMRATRQFDLYEKELRAGVELAKRER